MDKPDKSIMNSPPDKTKSDEENIASASKPKTRGRKRKRQDSESSLEDALPENALEVEKNLQSAALKNNLDDISVKKILKKVVTNDHVLALVKLREEEEIALSKKQNPKPKLTRAKAKELMKVSPKSAPWSLELTPIKHIPVKTRPEVEALISKDLPEDEDDDEYKPTHDDVPSDDDQTLESCSDVDSQPATPGTPLARLAASPQTRHDGPFKVPQSTPPVSARRKLVIDEEEATIALRTRSKLSLSATSIEHIESSFVPPDDVPMPIGDDLWNQFLEECLNPAETSRNEDDDDADPEYNVAADPDANDEDEDNGLLRISKKELNDLVTELFSIMPADEQLAERLASDVLADNAKIPTGPWEGKVEPISDEEIEKQKRNCVRTEQQKRGDTIRFSVGKSEPADEVDSDAAIQQPDDKENDENVPAAKTKVSSGYRGPKVVQMLVEEQSLSVAPSRAEREPPPLLRTLRARADDANTRQVTVQVDHTIKILPEQVLILQQQLRQHVQLAAGNFLQLYVNPAHWTLAPRYKDYLEQLHKMVEKNPRSVAGVCNLEPALELVRGWESSVAEDTPANKEMVEYIQSEAERSRRRFAQNSLYVGNFPSMFMEVVANSTVFLYPYLLPAMPYRADYNRKFGYRLPEDELIALGLDQFWQYIDENPQTYKKPRAHKAGRWGLVAACGLVVKHMLPWMSANWLMRHIMRTRKLKDNPIAKFFANREVTMVEHKLLPFNPKLTLYEQPEHEMPKIWIRFLAKTSKRFKYHYFRRSGTGVPPQGVPITVDLHEPIKKPLPADFTKTIVCHRQNLKPVVPEVSHDKFDLIVVTNAGPMLTINPMRSTNGGDVISMRKRVDVEISDKNSVPKGKVAILDIRPKLNKLTPATLTGTVVTANSQSGIVSNENNTVNNLVPNMYSLIKTSVGSYLVPLAVLHTTSTVNSITKPISSSTIEINVPKSSESDIPKSTENNIPKSTENNISKSTENNIPKSIEIVAPKCSENNVPETSEDSVSNCTENNVLESSENNLPECSEDYPAVKKTTRTAEDETTHCECCILLKKICKEKQSRITDFFRTKKTEERRCECTHRKFPKITKRLRMLVDNYKSRSWCEQRRIRTMLNLPGKGKKGKKDCDDRERRIEADEAWSLEDIEYVTTYHMKLTRRSALARNIYLKTKIHHIFSKFDPDDGDPIMLSKELFKAFGVELVDLYKEFMGFLTPEQADKIDRFKDYFVHSCIGDLVKRIESEVQEKECREAVLNQLYSIFSDNVSAACALCAGILLTLTRHPRLAKHVFSLFPHRTVKEEDRCDIHSGTEKSPSTPSIANLPVSEANEEQCAVQDEESETLMTKARLEEAEPVDNLSISDTLVVMDYETEHASSDEDNDNKPLEIAAQESESNITTAEETIDIKNEDVCENQEEIESIANGAESYDTSASTTTSQLVISEDEPTTQIKSEPAEWTREEDIFIINLVSRYLSENKKDKTALEVMDENNVYQQITDVFPYKHFDDIKERVMRIVDILVLSNY